MIRKSVLWCVGLATLLSMDGAAMAAPDINNTTWGGWTDRGSSIATGVWARGAKTNDYQIYTTVFIYDSGNPVPGTSSGFVNGDKILGVGVRNNSGATGSPIIKLDPDNNSYAPSPDGIVIGQSSFSGNGDLGDPIVQTTAGNPTEITIRSANPYSAANDYYCPNGGNWCQGLGQPGFRGIIPGAGVWKVFFDLDQMTAEFGPGGTRNILGKPTLDANAFGSTITVAIGGLGGTEAVVQNINSSDPCTTDCYVDPSGSNGNSGNPGSPFLTIQQGIDTVAAGGTVHVAAGTYEEFLYVDKPLQMRGANYGVAGDGARGTESVIEYPSTAGVGGIVLYVDADNVSVDGFEIRYPDSHIAAHPGTAYSYLWFSYGQDGLSIRNNRMYSSEIPIYIYPAGSPGDLSAAKSGLLIERNHIDCGPFVNSSYGRGMYIGYTAGTIQDNVTENCNIGIQYMPYGHTNPGVIQRNVVSAGLIGLYHNYQTKGAADVIWSENEVTIAPNDRLGLKAQLDGSWIIPVTFRGIHTITFGTQGSGGPPAVTFNNNQVDASLDPLETYNSTVLEAVRLSNTALGATATLVQNDFSNYTLAMNHVDENATVLATCNWWGDSAGPPAPPPVQIPASVDYDPWLIDPATVDPVAADACVPCAPFGGDTDSDGTCDDNETCDTDPAKTAPGICGCGVADTNTDGDSQADCNETCDSDPAKLAPGICGCGVADTNTDGDSQADCNETCDSDPAKLAPGICGCGVADTNTDGDSQADCNETCDSDPAKLAPGQCGCGNPDTDTDGDTTANCVDACPNDALNDVDGDTVCGDVDNCPDDANPSQADLDSDNIGDVCDTNDSPASLALSRVSIKSESVDTGALGRVQVVGLVNDTLAGTLPTDLALGNVYVDVVAGPYSATIALGACTSSGGRIRCRNDAAASKALFSRVVQGNNSVPDTWKMRVKRRLVPDVDYPVGPATVTLVQPTPSISRTDDISSCDAKPARLLCRED